MSRCTGHCCVEFPLRNTPSEIQDGREWFEDGDIVADMVVFKGAGLYEDGSSAYFYSCIHFDKQTRDCRIHEWRPRMCSQYPYGKPCDHRRKGCTLGGPDAIPDVPVSRLLRTDYTPLWEDIGGEA